MYKVIFYPLICFLICTNAFGHSISLEAFSALEESDVDEILYLIDGLRSWEYEITSLENGVELSIKGQPALEMMGYSKDSYRKPFLGLIKGGFYFDIYVTNSEERESIIDDFRCSQKRWPQKVDGLSHTIFRLRLAATATTDPLRLSEIWSRYNVCSKRFTGDSLSQEKAHPDL